MQTPIERVEAAIEDLKNGKMLILTDNPNREDEGDLIMPAETITAQQMNFIIRHTSGIVCLSLTKSRAEKLNLPLLLNSEDSSSLRAPFTMSIDAKEGIETGVSAVDRTKTIQAIVRDDVHADDFVKPGHIFPLQAKNGGVLERQGHTEGSVDIVRLAGFKPVAVLCEVMNADGTMARGIKLKEFAAEHQIKLLAIEDIVTYRLQKENLIAEEASTTLPLEHYGTFKVSVIKEKINGYEHILLYKEKINPHLALLVRIHSSCATGDLFSSKRCDCHKELHYSLQRISEEGGLLIYLNQEGRGIGLLNKIKAYGLQEHGFDTIEANQILGLPVDCRKYYIAANVLRNHNIKSIRLLTNNPDKVNDLKKYGITEVERESIPTFHNQHNYHYLKTKKEKLHHSINLNIC